MWIRRDQAIKIGKIVSQNTWPSDNKYIEISQDDELENMDMVSLTVSGTEYIIDSDGTVRGKVRVN